MNWLNVSWGSFLSVAMAIFTGIISLYIWRKTSRPIVTAIIETREGGNSGIYFNLQISNTGHCPAKNISLVPNVSGLKKAFGKEAREKSARDPVLACFKNSFSIAMLSNNERRSFSFGYTKENGQGFWKYGAKIPIEIEYEGLFKWSKCLEGALPWLNRYTQKQEIVILDSAGLAGYGWGKVSRTQETVLLTGDEIPQKIQKLIPSAIVTDSPNKPVPSPPA